MFAFAKYQAIGNDFVVVDGADLPRGVALCPLARALCDRRFGVGADGLLVVDARSDADLGMRIFNADGSEDTMCGNGLRCVVRWAHARGRVGECGVAWTRAGRIPFTVNGDAVTLELSPPRFGEPVACEGLDLLPVDTGSDHAVAFVHTLPADEPFRDISPRIEAASAFPNRTSLMWTVIEGPDRLRLRIWERGVGETLGCGTGASAAAVVARRTGRLTADTIAVASPGGTLRIGWAGGEADPIFLTGPAQRVFDGVWPGA